MYGLVVRVKIDPARGEEAAQMLKTQVVPMSRERAGFTGGYWLRSDDGTRGMSIELYESEAAARAIADSAAQAPSGAAVTLEGFEVFEVMATA
jgi:quinol monooxygenase YgiN